MCHRDMCRTGWQKHVVQMWGGGWGAQVGLQLWKADGKVFTCYTSMWDVIFYGELGSSLAILKAGYNLESFMSRYRGVDWRQESNWECNSR